MVLKTQKHSRKHSRKHSSKHSKKTESNKTSKNPSKTKKMKVAVEYEGRILDINPEEMRDKAKSLGGYMKAPLTLYRRAVFKLCDIQRGFVRVRDEGDKTTLTAKIFKNPDFPEEYELQIKESFEQGQKFLQALNLHEKAYHETIREKWFIPKYIGSKTELCELTIDFIPGLPPYSEIECKTKQDLHQACNLLKIQYKDLMFGGYGNVFVHYYGITANEINNVIPRLTFNSIESELETYIHKNRDLLKQTAKSGYEVYKKVKAS
jgi:adenylate cyclase class 2